jgi:5-oxoprolinase (ATP-hydrolysing)
VGYASDPRRREREVLFDEEGRVKRQYVGEAVELEGEVKQGLSGEAVRILREPDLDKVRKDLQALYDEGVRSLAVVFIHSYTYPGADSESTSLPPTIFSSQDADKSLQSMNSELPKLRARSDSHMFPSHRQLCP